MKEKNLVQLLCSMIVILIILYFIPFLGICLLILRGFIVSSKKKTSTPYTLIILGIILYIPLLTKTVLNILSLNNIPFISDILNGDLYNGKILGYARLLITLGVLYAVISYIAKIVASKAETNLRNYMKESEAKKEKIMEKNDLLIKERKEAAQNTHLVHCPHCGSDNMLSTPTGTCKFCRRAIAYKE